VAALALLSRLEAEACLVGPWLVGSILAFVLAAASGQTARQGTHDHAGDDQLDAATWCSHLIPDGSVYALPTTAGSCSAGAVRRCSRQGGGHPSVPAEVIATVLVLQALEGLSDREAISASPSAGFVHHVGFVPAAGAASTRTVRKSATSKKAAKLLIPSTASTGLAPESSLATSSRCMLVCSPRTCAADGGSNQDSNGSLAVSTGDA
jgi:hypothetical protein